MYRKAYAKINLSINVLGTLPNGYHDLDMLVLPIDLYDEMEMEVAEQMCYSCNIDLPFDRHNIIYKAVELLRREFGFTENFAIRVKKNIPMQGGMAGGSTNGASTLIMVNELLGLGLTLDQLATRGAKLGADVPYCVYSKPARIRGIGEIVEPFTLTGEYNLLLIKPAQGVSTKEAYDLLDMEKADHPDIGKLQQALVDGEPITPYLGNSIEQSAFRLLPVISQIIDECKGLGYPDTLMSGSGSTCFVISRESLDSLYEKMRNKYDFVYKTRVITDNI